MSMTTGRCLCAAIQFEFDGPVNWVAHCHCESCRRNTSSPMTTFIGVPRDRYRLLQGETAIYQSSPGVRRHFCGACGTPIAFDADKYLHEIHLYAASLTAPGDMVPEYHVFVGEKLPWMKLCDELPKYLQGQSDGKLLDQN